VSIGPEFTGVEQPFIDQLVSMGWEHTPGNVHDSSVTARANFRQVLLVDDLRAAIHRVNLDPDGTPWLDDARMSQAISTLQRPGAIKLMEANEASTELILNGTTVEGLKGWDGGRDRTVHFIDWENHKNNKFRVINQFRVDEPGGQSGRYAVPDLVLFVNGIPLVVAECKSQYLTSAPMEEAIEQLRRYSNQRWWLEGNEGNEKLFHANQFIVATWFDEARVGTISGSAIHYLEWKDTSPVPMAEVAAALGKEELSSQEKLVAGMLRPAHLLDIVRHFVLFGTSEGRTIKIAPRYQQFRAVEAAADRLLHGKTRAQDGEHDRRGGIIWHTQGSGKSFAMVFLVRKMRSDPELRRFKVVVVTDRKQLQKQLSDTAELTGEPVKIAKTAAQLKSLLAEKGPGLIFALIQKYRGDEGLDAASRDEFPVLNEDESVLVMVDEAHRSHASALHANLLKALANCARIGFTGTPIIMGAKRRTHEIFGDFIDRYTIKQSELDGATVPILYEGRKIDASVAEGADLDQLVDELLEEYTPEERERIKKQYATESQALQALPLIREKARDMFRHYVANILPNGFKAQVVTWSRRATIRYFEGLRDAQAELVEQLERLDESSVELDDEAIAALDEDQQFLARAHRFLGVIRELEFAPVISAHHNDPPKWREWTDEAKAEARTERFKKPLFHEDTEKRDPLAFLIVKSMLITGFDAPIEQVMYLDRSIREAELLQAIARVNRIYEKKKAGMVVAYYPDVAGHLRDALAAYAEEDIEGALKSLKDEIPKLRDRHQRVLAFFAAHGIDDIAGEDDCVALLRDERLRAEFNVKLKQFLETLDLVLPRPEGLAFLRDAKALGMIQARARNRYRGDERPIGREVGEKVRQLIDDHLVSEGIDPRIPPISIMDADFEEHVEAEVGAAAKASEMEHAVRYHIRKHVDEDPEHYQKLSQRLQEILAEFEGRWDELVRALKDFVKEVRGGREEDETGLDPKTQAPFLGVLKQEHAGDGDASKENLQKLAEATVELVDHLQQEVNLVGFWSNAVAQDVLRKWVVGFLDDYDLFEFDRLEAIADRVVELAKANQHRLKL
jgi:type I restriction enzyme R subunit